MIIGFNVTGILYWIIFYQQTRMAPCWSCLLCVLFYISSFIWHSRSVNCWHWSLILFLPDPLDLEINKSVLFCLQVQMLSSTLQIMLIYGLYFVCPKLWPLWVKFVLLGMLEVIFSCFMRNFRVWAFCGITVSVN